MGNLASRRGHSNSAVLCILALLMCGNARIGLAQGSTDHEVVAARLSSDESGLVASASNKPRELGASIAALPNLLAASAPGSGPHGSVFLYRHSAGAWKHTNTLRSNHDCSTPVALTTYHGDELLGVGCTTFSDGARRVDERVVVYRNSGRGFRRLADVARPASDHGFSFARSFSMSGKWIAIGDPNSLRMFVFRLAGGEYKLSATLKGRYRAGNWAASESIDGSHLAVPYTFSEGIENVPQNTHRVETFTYRGGGGGYEALRCPAFATQLRWTGPERSRAIRSRKRAGSSSTETVGGGLTVRPRGRARRTRAGMTASSVQAPPCSATMRRSAALGGQTANVARQSPTGAHQTPGERSQSLLPQVSRTTNATSKASLWP